MPCGGFGERVVNTMAESKNYIVQPQEGGNILISEDVIASIASLAVREVEGVYGLSATQTLDLTAILGKKNLSSGIRVTLQDNVIDIACNLVVRMGQPVMTVAKNVQEGIANAVGFAIAETMLAAHFNRPGFPVVDHRVYAFCGDGCMMEGIASEAAALAAERQSFTFTLHTKET